MHPPSFHCRAGQTPSILNASTSTLEELEAKRAWEAEKPLSDRLKVETGEELDIIPPQLLRRYVAYARKYVHPKITPECAKVIRINQSHS